MESPTFGTKPRLICLGADVPAEHCVLAIAINVAAKRLRGRRMRVYTGLRNGC